MRAWNAEKAMRFVVSWLQEYLGNCLEEYRGQPLDPVELAETLTLAGLEAEIVSPDSQSSSGTPGETVVALDLTPNRPDCMSILGVAREFCVDKGQRFVHTIPELPAATGTDPLSVEVQVLSPEACPLYRCCEVRDVACDRETPDWMAERLLASEMRPLSLIVDVMNYVMLELGQPLHAFDLDRLTAKKIFVGLAEGGEVFELLDGNSFTTPKGTLLIRDGGGPVALAGAMGAKQASVQQDTRNILIEAAFFAPSVIRKVARIPGMYTEAARRFEKGVDFQLSQQALDRAVTLLADIAGGKPGGRGEWRSESHLPARQAVVLSRKTLDLRLGVKPDSEWIEKTLMALGCEVKSDGEEWACVPPSFRFDLEIEVDFVEEIARLYGYERIADVPAETFSAASRDSQFMARRQRQHSWSDGLVALGYSEVITLCFADFVDPVKQRLLSPVVYSGHKSYVDGQPELPAQIMVDIRNPLSRCASVMRTTLWLGLIEVLRYNLNRGARRACFFEVGKIYYTDVKSGVANEKWLLGGLAFGPVSDDSWSEKLRERDYYDVKGDLESLLQPGLGELEWKQLTESDPLGCGLVHGKSAEIRVQNKRIGTLGMMKPGFGGPNDFDLNLAGRDVFLFEIYMDQLPEPERQNHVAVSRYPTQRFDISLMVPANRHYTELFQCIKALDIPELYDFFLLDVFPEKVMAEGERSMTLAFVLQGQERTLTDIEVAAVVHRIVDDLQRKLGVKQRYPV